MKRLVEFPLNNGTDETLLVEIDEPEQEGLVPATPADVIQKAEHTFEQALEKIKPVAESIVKTMHKLSERPDEVSVTFGLKLSAAAGAFIASAGAEANYEVTLIWRRKEANEPQGIGGV